MIFGDPVAGRVQGYVRRKGSGRGHLRRLRGCLPRPRDLYPRPPATLPGSPRGPRSRTGCRVRPRGVSGSPARAEPEYTGVDPDPEMVGHCRAKGHEPVEEADANSYLENCADDSIGAIFCAQVIEHLPYKELLRFFGLAAEARTRRTVYSGDRKPALRTALKPFGWTRPTSTRSSLR